MYKYILYINTRRFAIYIWYIEYTIIYYVITLSPLPRDETIIVILYNSFYGETIKQSLTVEYIISRLLLI